MKVKLLKLSAAIFCSLYFSFALAQQGLPPLDFNHIFFITDTGSFEGLARNKFLTDTLFYYDRQLSETDQGNWEGQYLNGSSDYWEIFHPGAVSNGTEGDIGLGFMIRQPKMLSSVRQHWQAFTDDSLVTEVYTSKKSADTIIVELMNYRDSMLTGGAASLFVMHYGLKVLEASGFTDAEIQQGITQSQLNEKWKQSQEGERIYNKTEKIFIELTPHEYERHTIALKALGFKETREGVFKKDIEIYIKKNEAPGQRLKKIEFSLTRNTAPRKEVISPSMYVELAGAKGLLVMQ